MYKTTQIINTTVLQEPVNLICDVL